MKKIHCVIFSNYRKFKNPKIAYIFEKKTFVLSVMCSKFENKDEKIFTEKESVEISKIIGLIKNI